MKIKDKYTQASLKKAIRDYLDQRKGGVCSCGERLRKGFLNCIFVDKEGKTSSDYPEPVPVPYCEQCDPPDGFNYTYSTMVIVAP
jgi:hypothetical protein